MPVYTWDGERIGWGDHFTRVAFLVTTGELEAFWLRRAAIDRITPGGVIYLSVRKDQLHRWIWRPHNR